jgi:cytochrome c oxidase assembly factor CtaG
VSERPPPFDVVKACFLLLATVMLVTMLETLLAVLGCLWLIVVQQTQPVGGCINISAIVRDLLTEMLTAILALIVAARSRE